MRPKLKEEGSPMESYVGLDVHSKRSVFVIEAEDGRVVARGDIPTTPAGFRQLRQQHELAAETPVALDRKSTRLNSSHITISYAVFCLKKKKPSRAIRRTTSTQSQNRT